MRIEQTIAAVARVVAVAIVREIKAVVSFVRETRLHQLWLQRMPWGMPAYALVPACMSTCCGNPGRLKHEWQGHGLGTKPFRLRRGSAFGPTGLEQG